MAGIPNIPSPPGGGSRQERAAQLRAEFEGQESQSSESQATESQTSEQAPQGTGPLGEGDHVVRDGDCISSIALNAGHFWETVWNDSANSALKSARKDPNLLLPKDCVHVPPIREKDESGQTEMRHRFVRRGEPSKLRLRLVDDEDVPRANEPYTLKIDGKELTGTTDVNGQFEQNISGAARKVLLCVGADQAEYKMVLGTVDPFTEISGVQKRLNNLDFNCGRVDGKLGPKTRKALGLFQSEHGLDPTEKFDAPTKAKLEEVFKS